MQTHSVRAQKGFTLLELLIVVAILAILTTLVIVVLNPAELLAQGRDSQRLSDLASIKSATALFLKDRGCDTAAPSSWTGNVLLTNHSIAGTNDATNRFSTSRAVDGNGWVPINYSGIPSGSPLSVLPIDPTNNATFHYHFRGDTTANNCGFELTANMQSTLYRNGGSDDKENNTRDGGNNDDLYETGTQAGLTLIGAPAN